MRSDNIKFIDIFWNTLGSVTYALISLLISIVVINLTGKIEGGIFSFGMSTLAHQVYIVSYFGIRPMHIVDIKYRYSFSDYLNFGIKASVIGILLGAIYILYMLIKGTYTSTKFMLLLILVLHGAIDGFADYYECEYQRVNKLYMGGQSLFFRITLFTLALLITLVVSKNLLYAELVAIAVEVIAFFFLNIKRSKDVFKSARLNDETTKNRNLFLESFPLFLIVFLDMFIFSITKFSIDANIGDVASGFFNLLFMPTNGIYLIMNLFMKPYLTPLSNAYYTSKTDYSKLLGKAMIVSLLISVVFAVGTWFLGFIYLDLLNIITKNIYAEFADISKKMLFIIILGGCFYSINTPLYYSLIIEKKQKFLCIAYVLTAVLAFFATKVFVVNMGLMGAAYSFLVDMFMLCVGVVIVKALTL